jgi:hypothetical protein
MHNLFRSDESSFEHLKETRMFSGVQRLYEWTETHCWYTIMGGFVIDMRGFPRNFVPGSPDFQTLSPEGLLLLARCMPEVVPDVSEEDILDESKANGFQKVVVCIQATWFLVSTVFRMSSGYPIALLELNTFAHALCALLIYFIWWQKPLDVSGSIIIDGQRCEDMVAFLTMASHCNGRRELELFYYQQKKSSHPRVRFNPKPSSGIHSGWYSSAELDKADDNALEARLKVPVIDPTNHTRTLQVPDSYRILQMWQTLYGFSFEVRNEKPPRSPHSIKQRPYIVLTTWDVLRWCRASEAVERFLTHEEEGQSYINFSGYDYAPELNPDRVPDLLVNRVHNWPTNILSFTKFHKRDISTHVAFILSAAFYGGLHLLASGAPFYSTAELVLWYLSAVGLCVSGPVLIMSLYSNFMYDMLDRDISWLGIAGSLMKTAQWKRSLDVQRSIIQGLFFFYNLPICSVIIIFARVFLIVECFLNLFRLDGKVFDTPNWVNYLPSIS